MRKSPNHNKRLFKAFLISLVIAVTAVPRAISGDERFTFPEKDISSLEGYDFSSARLIIDGETADPEHLLSSYDGVSLLQYDTEEEAKTAFLYYRDTARFVDVDTLIPSAANANVLKETTLSSAMTAGLTPFDRLKVLTDKAADTKGSPSGQSIAFIGTGVNDDAAAFRVSFIGDDPGDGSGHGTALAASIHNKYPDAALISLKAFESSGTGYLSAVYAAVKYANTIRSSAVCLSFPAPPKGRYPAIDAVLKEAEDAGTELLFYYPEKGFVSTKAHAEADSDTDSLSPAYSDGNTDTGQAGDAGSNPDTESPVDTDSGPDAESPVDTDGGPDAESLVDADSGPDAESPVDADSNPDAESPVDTDSDPDARSLVDADGDPDDGSPVDADNNNDARTNNDKDKNKKENPNRDRLKAPSSVYTMSLRFLVNKGTIQGIRKYSDDRWFATGSYLESEGLNNGVNFVNQGIYKSSDNGVSWARYTVNLTTETEHLNIINADETGFGVVRSGYVIDRDMAFCTTADGSGVLLSQNDSESNTVNPVTTKRINGGTQITRNCTVDLYVNWIKEISDVNVRTLFNGSSIDSGAVFQYRSYFSGSGTYSSWKTPGTSYNAASGCYSFPLNYTTNSRGVFQIRLKSVNTDHSFNDIYKDIDLKKNSGDSAVNTDIYGSRLDFELNDDHYSLILDGNGGTTHSTSFYGEGASSVTAAVKGTGSTSLRFHRTYRLRNSPQAAASLESPCFTRPGYVFNGWNTERNGSGTRYATGYSITFEDLSGTNGGTATLYAQWTPRNGIVSSSSMNGITVLPKNLEEVLRDASGINYFIPYLKTNQQEEGIELSLPGQGFSWDGKYLVYNSTFAKGTQDQSVAGSPVILLKERARGLNGRTYDVKITISDIKVTVSPDCSSDVECIDLFEINSSGRCSMRSRSFSSIDKGGIDLSEKTGISYHIKIDISDPDDSSHSAINDMGLKTMLYINDLDMPDQISDMNGDGTAEYSRTDNKNPHVFGGIIYKYAESVSVPVSAVAEENGSRFIYVNRADPSGNTGNAVFAQAVDGGVRVTGTEYTEDEAMDFGTVPDTDPLYTSIIFTTNAGSTEFDYAGMSIWTHLFASPSPVKIKSWVGNENGPAEESDPSAQGTITEGGSGTIEYPKNTTGLTYTAQSFQGYLINELKFRKTSDENWTNISEASGLENYSFCFDSVAPSGIQDNYQIFVNFYRNTGFAAVTKVSADSSVTEGDPDYSLEGAVFGVYSSLLSAQNAQLAHSLTGNETASMTTDSAGFASVELDPGTYYIAEITASPGYLVNEEIHTVTVTGGNTANITIEEEPFTDIDVTITKTLDKEDLYADHGAPNFAFEISGTTLKGEERIFHTVIDFTGADESTDTVSLSRTITIPAGEYTIKELATDRYVLTDITAVTDNLNVVKNETGENASGIRPVTGYAEGLLKEHAEVSFTNRKIRWDDYSHTSAAENSFDLSE